MFGLIRTTRSVLLLMKKQMSGTIVNLSSGLRRFDIAARSAYASSKFAVEGLSESISFELEPFELEPFGIRIIMVEPGVIKTNFIKSVVLAKKSNDRNSPYIQLIKSIERRIENLVKNAT